MTVPMLRSLFLRRFRSFPLTEVGLDNPTFLVGQNGSGKSNFADSFAFLAEAMASRCKRYSTAAEALPPLAQSANEGLRRDVRATWG